MSNSKKLKGQIIKEVKYLTDYPNSEKRIVAKKSANNSNNINNINIYSNYLLIKESLLVRAVLSSSICLGEGDISSSSKSSPSSRTICSSELGSTEELLLLLDR